MLWFTNIMTCCNNTIIYNLIILTQSQYYFIQNLLVNCQQITKYDVNILVLCFLDFINEKVVKYLFVRLDPSNHWTDSVLYFGKLYVCYRMVLGFFTDPSHPPIDKNFTNKKEKDLIPKFSINILILMIVWYSLRQEYHS